MSDLWVQYLDNLTSAGFHYRRASRSDVLEWLGWEKCDHCDGEGTKDDGRTDGNWTEGKCDWCRGLGLVPPASQVEAAGDGIEALGYDTLELRNWGEGSVPGAIDIVARAALIAAMEGVGE